MTTEIYKEIHKQLFLDYLDLREKMTSNKSEGIKYSYKEYVENYFSNLDNIDLYQPEEKE